MSRSISVEDRESLKLARKDAVLLVIDVQERLARAMADEAMDRVRKNIVILVEGAKVLGLPVLITEQYPRGLGPTVPEIRAALPQDTRTIEKTAFSCYRAQPVKEALRASGRRQVIACGMESHVCVFQTVRDLLDADFSVFVAQDAVISRAEENLRVGLSLMERGGAVVSSTETCLFDLLQEAGTAEFKAISALVR